MSQLDPTAAGVHTNAVLDSYDYVIVGAGIAAAKAIDGIRAEDADGTLGLFGADTAPPIYRPDLSKTLWLEPDATVENSLMIASADDGPQARTQIHLGTAVTDITPADHRVTLTGGRSVGYGTLLLATGAEPTTGGLEPGDRVVHFRTLDDYRRLRKVATAGAHVVVVGGGYIGSEVAAALAQNDVQVTLVVAEQPLLGHMFPDDLAAAVTQEFTGQGVQLVAGLMDGGSVRPDGVTIRLSDGTEVSADAVVLGIGVSPRTDLAARAGLTVDDGIVVDEHLRTSDPDIYAAGDVARFPDALLGVRRVEHAMAAETQGELAGRNMAGADQPYTTTPFFWSDLFDYGYEAIGEIDTRHDTVADWKRDENGQPDHSTGVVYYLDQGRVRGVLLWNVWDAVEQARELISRTAREPVSDPESLPGTIALG